MLKPKPSDNPNTPNILHGAFGIKGSVLLELVDPDGNIVESKIFNNINDNLRSAVASVLAAQATNTPQYIAVGTGARTNQLYATSNVDAAAVLGVAGQDMLAQETIDSGAAGRTAYILLWMKRLGTSAGSLSVEIQTNAAGLPSNTALTNGISSTVPINGLGLTYDWVKFDFTTPPTLTINTVYHVVLKSSGYVYSAGVTEVSWGVDTTSPTYAGGDFEKATGTTWSAYSPAADGAFRMVTQTDSLYTTINGELSRKLISSRSKQSTTIARLLASFPAGTATDYIGHVGLFDLVSAGTLFAIGTTRLNKLANQTLNVYWLLEVL